ncbi:30S ribosomal protein S8 [Candidatus Woesearchaeota archaeon]|nr:30S ribosomal protein S8 [Candidatus Woesearchaeota archaeon]
MSLNDTLATVLSQIDNAVHVGKSSITTKHGSKQIKTVLSIMHDKGYIGNYEEVIDSKGNYFVVSLIGSLNKCGVVKPRFSVKADQLERYEKQFLPARDFGVLIISTNQGMMSHIEAKEKGIGGRLISYCY